MIASEHVDVLWILHLSNYIPDTLNNVRGGHGLHAFRREESSARFGNIFERRIVLHASGPGAGVGQRWGGHMPGAQVRGK